jgi:hypothetical protein
MRLGRQGAVLTLAAAVLWTAMPAFACLLNLQPTPRHGCCSEMAKDCDPVAMAATGSCCQAREQSAVIAPVPLFAPKQAQVAATAPSLPSLQALTPLGVRRLTPHETPPPKSSSGGAFTLRI